MIKYLTVYSSGAPNYFTYGVSQDDETYSLINNQYWVRSSRDFTDQELATMIKIDIPRTYNVQDN